MAPEISVLHVDDEPDFADMAAQFLTRASDRLAVDTALNADEALSEIQRGGIDCLVSDYEMPGRNGIELLHAVREEFPDLPFILFTGKGSEEIASDAISAGVTEYLQKERGSDQYVVLANRIENAVDKTRAERRAEEHQAIYRSLTEDALDTSEVGTFILDSEFEIVWINSAVETYFEIDREVVIGEDKRQLIDSHIATLFEDPEGFADTVTATYDDNSYVEEFECHILPTEGRDERWLRHWSQPIQTGYFAGGRIEHYTDITEYKSREREISRLNELHETVLANIRDTVLLTDDDGRFTYICPNVEYIFGYDETEVADFGTIEGLLGERLVEADELAEQGEIHNLETSVEDREGRRRELLVTVSAVEIDEGSCLYSIRDITDRVDRERDYRDLNRRLQLALEATDTGVWEWNMETDEVVWSEALERLLGIEPGTFEGTFEAHTEYLHPESVAKITDGVEQALEDGSEFEEEFRMVREDGEVIWVHGQGKVFREDEPPRMVGITTEITERKARERELEERNQQLDSFASMVSHDLRNPLNVAEGRLELAKETCESEDLQAVDRALERMGRLVDDLLALAREGEAVTGLEPVDLAGLADECWEQLDADGHAIDIEATQTVQADRSRLRQLLENLLRNATEHGGETVTVTVGDLEDGFYVEDDGVGIPESDRPTVFDSGYSTKVDGTGLGLSIVQEIADGHGWTVRVSESDHGGARFEFGNVQRA